MAAADKTRGAALKRGDIDYLSALQAAQQLEAAPMVTWALYLMLTVMVVTVTWATVAKVDMVARAPARVVPEGREQLIASLEGGILRELKVREGEAVEVGQALALLDPTRMQAQQAESRAKRLALMATAARLQAEAAGRPLVFPNELQAVPDLVRGEADSYNARQRALNEAASSNNRNLSLLERELAVAEQMSAKGLMSNVEVMRLRRQINDMGMNTFERTNRFRQDASAELVKVQTELALMSEQQVVRDDQLRRTVLTSPVRGLVKNIRANTLGGVVAAGAPVMEVVPVGDQVLVEARIKPSDIGFVRVGQRVEVKLTAYEFAVYGSLHGEVEVISPDALGDPDRSTDTSYYRALVRADPRSLNQGKNPLTVLPGMVGTAEIAVGQRSVISFVLRPLLKANEAFTER